MKRPIILLLSILLAGCLGAAAQAPLVVYDYGIPGSWVTSAKPGDTNPTFVLPANLTGVNCGAENEPACEPYGGFVIKTPWSGIPSIITMTEPNGAFSDVISFDSKAYGNFRITFFSDPANGLAYFPGYALYANYPEDATNGFVGTVTICCEVYPLQVTLASDGESFFDPFGYGFDTSDGIQFLGANYGGHIPEPGTLLLLGSGILGLGGVIRRKINL